MRFSFIPLCLCALATLFFVVGCGRYEASPTTAEIDEPGYRRGKELVRQGRNHEALASFLKVVEKRGDDAPESHLELGILYQQHIKDPIAAIYHYRKFRELKRNSPQSDLVRQRIDAATREFARTLPGRPLDNQADRMDLLEKMDQIQRENVQLKEQLIALRTQAVTAPRQTQTPQSQPAGGVDHLSPQVIEMTQSPVMAATDTLPIPPVPQPPPQLPPPPLAPPTRPAVQSPPPVQQPPVPPPAANTAYRRHVVVKGDTLFSLAQRYYGNRSRWRDIYAANRHVLPNESALTIGMELRIPQ